MRIFTPPLLIFAAISLVFTATLSTASGASPSEKSQTIAPIPTTKSAGNEVSSAQCGVRLLEHILERMRNLPQLALSKNKQTIAFNSQEPANRPSPCQPNLLIQPKSLSRALDNITMLASPFIAAAPAPSSKSIDSNATDQLVARQEKDDKSNASPVVWQRSGMMQSAPQIVSFKAGQNVSPSGGVTEYGQSSDAARLDQAKKVISNSPLITEFPSGKISPGSVHEVAILIPPENLDLKEECQKSRMKCKASMRESRLSLLPPTVIAGIPLVKLGNSEKEVSAVASAFGDVQKQSVHNWSVWSFYKAGSGNCTVQIFFRRGMVEAIRVFDCSCCRPDLGVTVGDQLSKVKEKFGEPAFILAEQSGLTTQNYIYPISQVGFQLARQNIERTPKIVSMIIFNVR